MASKVYYKEEEAEAYAAMWMEATFNWYTELERLAPDFHFGCWWLFWTGAITLGGNVYVKRKYITGRLIRHECTHVWQQHKDGWKFYPRYVWQWIRAGFSYTNIEYEQEARAYEKVNANM